MPRGQQYALHILKLHNVKVVAFHLGDNVKSFEDVANVQTLENDTIKSKLHA